MLVSPLQFLNAWYVMLTTLYVFPSITTFEGIVTEPSTQFSFVTSAVESVKILNLSGDSDSSTNKSQVTDCYSLAELDHVV